MPTTLSGLCIACLALLLCGCYKNHLYVQQEHLSREFLASSYVGTPDPELAKPPEGERLVVAWDFPSSVFGEHLALHVTVRFWDNTQREITYALPRRRGVESFGFPDTREHILTYRVDVWSAAGVCLESWKHHFWTELIEVESRSSAASTSSAVSSQPRQGSVIETP